MYIDTKYLKLQTECGYVEYPPKIYIDFFVIKSNLKRRWRDNSSFQFEIGFFGLVLSGNINWGFVERERTKEEEDTYQKTLKFFEKLGVEIENGEC